MDKSHILFHRDSLELETKPVVLYKTAVAEEPNLAVKKFIGAGLITLFVGVIGLQAGWVINAKAEGNPATSPITSEESPSPSPSGSGAPITSPENPNPSIKITSPNGGETFNNGDPIRITWEQSNAKACLFAYSNNAIDSSVFSSADLSKNYLDWTVQIENMAPGASVQAKVKVSCYDSTGHYGAQDESDNFFTVVNPGTPITAPEVSPSPSSNPSNNNGGGNNGNSNGGSVGAPSCNSQAPSSAPKIISAVTTGKNEITLSWTKAGDPANNYVIAYGVQKGKPLYGASIGNVTTFSVKGLSGGFTYFFKVRGGNDCQPGAYSQELAVKVGGKFINAPAQGFQAGVLGKTIKKNMPLASVSSSPIASAAPQSQTNGGLFGKVFNFLSNLFKP